MKCDSDAFERELETFRPADVSADLERRIGVDLRGAEGHERRLPLLRRSLMAASLVAAGVLTAFLLLPPAGAVLTAMFGASDEVRLPQVDNRDVPAVVEAVPEDSDAPTLQTYQRALAASPEALDAVLARHAADFGGSRDPNSYDLRSMLN